MRGFEAGWVGCGGKIDYTSIKVKKTRRIKTITNNSFRPKPKSSVPGMN